MIKEVTLSDDFKVFSQLLNDSFSTVAKEFGFTKETAPTNNAFVSADGLKSQLTEKRQFYYYENNGQVIGFIAVEKSSRDALLYYIEKLAVTPEFRHNNIGRELMDFATEKIKKQGGSKISVGLINSNIRLKNWYRKLGFEEVEIKEYNYLPFSVCIMDKCI
ncbi:MAG: GNAT family N-acetyltransferase [Dysgonomonas sp.]|nr:GNAT family N-acetyltransferase [Dysgonomonas sp.]